ncbi:hypothetical protein LQW54_003045 [Pestalotiopsis sp. IQ-011]
MAPVQQTFSLIPELPSALHGGEQEQGRVSRPPMTTKQAKKAYKAKNKGPKLSKAEQRRQDLMEQDRIRREFEKERNQARAKAARDKRKEKEDREKAEKKRKGVPLVEVHPSQDTLARFLRRPITPVVGQKPGPDLGGLSARQNHSPRNNEEKTGPPVVSSEEDDSDTTLPAEDEPERPKKRPRVGSSPRPLSTIENAPHDMFNESTTKLNVNRDTSPVKAKPPQNSPAAVGKEPVSTAASLDPDDPIVEDMVNRQILTESFSADDGLFDDLDFEALEMQTVAQDATHIKAALPPSMPPDSRPSPRKEQTAVDKNGQVNKPFSPTEVVGSNSYKKDLATRSQNVGRVEDCETVNPGLRGLPDDNASTRPVMQQTSGNKTTATSPEIEDLTSSFTDDELAELLSENFEIDEDEPEPEATEFASEAALQQTPVRTQSSPKPFFTSSGTKEKFILAFEKTRTDTWRNDNARRQGQEELDVLCRQEEERQQRILLEKLLESEEQFGEEAGVTSSPAQMKSGQAQSSSAKSNDSTRSQNSTAASKKTRQRTHPHGSYEKMLEMLEKGKEEGESTREAEVAPGRKESNERHGSMEQVITASQGSDYGDLILDLDDFPDF